MLKPIEHQHGQGGKAQGDGRRDLEQARYEIADEEEGDTIGEVGSIGRQVIERRSHWPLPANQKARRDVYERDGFTVTAIFTSIYAVLKGFTLISTKA